jgi:alpha-1,6-mannosyltransferase
MKTVHLTNSWHETSGGIATFYRALIAAANRRGHYIRLVVPGERERQEDAGEFGRIYYLKAPRAQFNSQYRTIYPSQYIPAGSPLQKILAAEHPDLIEICDKYTLNYLGALLRRGLLRELHFRPVVVGLSCERMDDNFRTYVGRLPLAASFCASYMKWLYFPFFDHHIANSTYTAEELGAASRDQMVPRNTWIRPMGIDLEHLSPLRRSLDSRRQLQQTCGARDDSVFLLYVGRLVPEKNLSLLFGSLARLARNPRRDYRLVVAGDGIERSHWERFCRKHAPGRVTFLGHVKDPDTLADLLANAVVFVHPNPREPFGIAPLEAMASGLPLVVPDSGGVTSYANGKNAWLAQPDEDNFAAAVEATLEDQAERERRVRNALRTAGQYRWETAAASFLDLYSELHSYATTQSKRLPLPAFRSIPAEGLRLSCSRGLSRSAEKIFALASTVLSRSRP